MVMEKTTLKKKVAIIEIPGGPSKGDDGYLPNTLAAVERIRNDLGWYLEDTADALVTFVSAEELSGGNIEPDLMDGLEKLLEHIQRLRQIQAIRLFLNAIDSKSHSEKVQTSQKQVKARASPADLPKPKGNANAGKTIPPIGKAKGLGLGLDLSSVSAGCHSAPSADIAIAREAIGS
ncbi:hypothetical protein PPROV_000043600 [Pycnococcus provasolii]|uniref:Uncharacterized protein n=1 Tax=Pycnococcus provasolii TaxID=41880 RepID=A0A830H809_9CHLO|nr:hypothetical protein PPROV_000043600 [Pycnococcus provasolii]